ncbi:MAG: hypothetical protein Q7T76_19515 [Ferruginibacter sp.]|nr:hypothetical protein [Ferruginibacter sp.]
MIYKGKDPIEGTDKTSEQLFADEKTDEKIRRHFSDINDVITEADIENVKTNFGEAGTTLDTNLPLTRPADKQESNAGEEESEEQETTPVVTPWNVIKP